MLHSPRLCRALPRLLSPTRLLLRGMATINDSAPSSYRPHVDRTASQPRDNDIYAVTLSKITPAANGSIRLLRLEAQDAARGIKVRPASSISLPRLHAYTPQAIQLTGPSNSTVPPRPMARYTHPYCLQDRRLHHHLASHPRESKAHSDTIR
jgi:hypothetical protein